MENKKYNPAIVCDNAGNIIAACEVKGTIVISIYVGSNLVTSSMTLTGFNKGDVIKDIIISASAPTIATFGSLTIIVASYTAINPTDNRTLNGHIAWISRNYKNDFKETIYGFTNILDTINLIASSSILWNIFSQSDSDINHVSIVKNKQIISSEVNVIKTAELNSLAIYKSTYLYLGTIENDKIVIYQGTLNPAKYDELTWNSTQARPTQGITYGNNSNNIESKLKLQIVNSYLICAWSTQNGYYHMVASLSGLSNQILSWTSPVLIGNGSGSLDIISDGYTYVMCAFYDASISDNNIRYTVYDLSKRTWSEPVGLYRANGKIASLGITYSGKNERCYVYVMYAR